DSNLSANFPTTAQLGTHLLAAEGGPQVDGVVALNEPVIARILGIVGPVTVPEYHQVVSEQNLEMIIRQYTENQAVLMTPGHQQFTVMLGHAFMSKLHGLATTQLVAIAQSLLASVRTKDIQIYLSDPTTEALLSQQGLDGSITHCPGDGLTIVD